jgi:phage terminase large subunit
MRHRNREKPTFNTGWLLFWVGLGILLWYLIASAPAFFCQAVAAPVINSVPRRINPNLRYLAECHRTGKSGAILEGSSRSGKTWSSVDFIIQLCTKAKQPLTINIIRQTYNGFKTTLYDDFNRRLPSYGLVSPFDGKKEVSTFFIFGSKINLLGADKDSAYLGVSCDYLYFNEILDIPQGVFDQAEMRCRRFWWGDYNPKATVHWVYDKISKRKDVGYLRTTFLDNPNISASEKRKILSYEPTHPEDRELNEDKRRPHPTNIDEGTADTYMWNVYGLGLRSAPEGLVFQNVTWIQSFPTNIEKIFWGSDIGYTNSPSTLVKMGVDGNNLYLQMLHHGPTPSSNEYIPIIRQHNPKGITWADSAEPGYIVACRKVGLHVLAVNKFAGSIIYGISLLKKYKIHIVDCPEWRNEQANYKYREVHGIRLEDPIDDFNHLWDAARYAALSNLTR